MVVTEYTYAAEDGADRTEADIGPRRPATRRHPGPPSGSAPTSSEGMVGPSTPRCLAWLRRAPANGIGPGSRVSGWDVPPGWTFGTTVVTGTRTLGVGQDRNRLRRAVEGTVPIDFCAQTLVSVS